MSSTPARDPGSTAALLLLPGDPLPPLRVTPPLVVDAFAGRWLLLLSARDPGVPAAIARALSGRVTVCLLQLGGDTSGPAAEPLTVYADAAGLGADALGAFAPAPASAAAPDGQGGGAADSRDESAAASRPQVAALVDPRGTVQACCVWQSCDDVTAAVSTCLGRGR